MNDVRLDELIPRPRHVGQLLKNRYKIVDVHNRTLIPRHYRVADFYVPGRMFWVREYPVPFATPAEAWQMIENGVEEENRILSWLQLPGLILPRELFCENHCVCVVDNTPGGAPLDEYLLRHRVSVHQAVAWTVRACELVGAMHAACPRPLFLGCLSENSLALDGDGRLQLLGLQLDDSFRLRFRCAPDAESWTAPEGAQDARSDVWCLGTLLRRLLSEAEYGAPAHGLRRRLSREAEHRAELERIADAAVHAEPAQRTDSVARLRRQLEHALKHLPHHVPRSELPTRRLVWEESYPLVAVMVPFLAAMVLLAGFAWGMHGVEEGLALLGSGMHATRLATAVRLSPGTEIWTEGTVAARTPGATVTSPLGAAPCVGYTARLTRRLRREVWDASDREYRLRTWDEVLVSRSRCLPFVLRDGAARIAVEPADPTILGSALVLDSIPAYLQEAAQAPTKAPNDDVLQIPPLRVGEHVIATHGREIRIAAGDRVYIRAVLQREKGRPVLATPPTAPLIIYQGSWWDYVGYALRAVLPGAGSMLASLLLLAVGGARWRRRRRWMAARAGAA